MASSTITPTKEGSTDGEVRVLTTLMNGVGIAPAKTEDPTPTKPPCPTCSAPTPLSSCSNCLLVSYCSPRCQKADWKRHKHSCFPVATKYDSICGRYLVSTRAIKQGEVFLREKPLLSAPSSNEEGYPICLSCYRVVKSGYKCKCCSWPVCDESCQGGLHSKYECGLFTQKGVTPSRKSSSILPNVDYENVKVLRGLLLQNLDPQKYEKLQSLEPHTEKRDSDLPATYLTSSAIHFVKDSCGLDYTIDEVKFVSGVVHINGMGSDDLATLTEGKLYRSSTHLYHTGSMAGHSCTPNILRIIQLNGELNFKAIVDIGIGEPILTVYADVLKGTHERRLYLERGYYFSCGCRRCGDPTEMGTHYSSLKCQCTEGYLTSINPLDNDSDWGCGGCNKLKPIGEVQQIINSVKEEINLVPYMDSMSSVEKLEAILRKYSGIVLHPNHYLITGTEYDIAQRIDYLLKSGAVPPSGITYGRLAKRQLEVCRKNLEVTALIWPGGSQHRGRLLHFLQSGILNYISSVRKTPRNRIELIQLYEEAIQARLEGSRILTHFPPGRDEYIIARQLTEETGVLAGVKRMLNI